MARGRIQTLTPDTTYELMTKIITMCSSSERAYSELFSDEFVHALREEYGERVVKDYIMSMCKLGFIEKNTVTHVRFSTTLRGKRFIDSNKRK